MVDGQIGKSQLHVTVHVEVMVLKPCQELALILNQLMEEVNAVVHLPRRKVVRNHAQVIMNDPLPPFYQLFGLA